MINLLYGNETVGVAPDSGINATVIEKPSMPVLDDPKHAIERALKEAVGCGSLASLAEGRGSACIAICDITRPVPNGLVLPPLIKTLIDSGVDREKITILIATGLHRPNEGEEMRELIGSDWVMEKVEVVNHFARDDDMHVDLGVTPTRGTPIRIDRRFVEADLRIVVGLVEPHFMAGYSGGRKIIAPGIAHADTIRTFHNHAFMNNPAAVSCNFAGNPLHEEQLEILKVVGEAYAVNTVLDDERRLSFVNFGEILESHMASVEYARGFMEVPMTRRFKTIVTSSAGEPLDKTYYQTVKGMVTLLDILEPGGSIIMISRCVEGLGSEEFKESQRRLKELGRDTFLEVISKQSLAEIDEWQTQMQTRASGLGDIHLYSEGIPEEDFDLTGAHRCDDVAGAIRACVERHGDADVAFIPEGPYVVPRFTGG